MKRIVIVVAFLLWPALTFAADYPCLTPRVIDGDTVVCSVSLGFRLYIQDESIRLVGIDAPELNTAAGVAAKTALISKMGTRPVTLRTTGKRDKYGRTLGDLIVDGESMAGWMLANGYAVPYNP